jgi:hypothetical protein
VPKFSGRPVAPAVRSAIQTEDTRIQTFEQAGAYARTPESDLFLLAATNMVGEKTFYESAAQRDSRFIKLVRQVTETNPTFISGRPGETFLSLEAGGAKVERERVGFAQYLREELLMRSATVVLVAEYVAAGGPNGRSVVARSLQRPDEPAELLGYWLSHHGRKIPAVVKRGIADAAARMYSERNTLKYDGQSRSIRFADVIDLTHPKPKSLRQSAVFKFALDRRHDHVGRDYDFSQLPMLAADAALLHMPEEERRPMLRESPQRLAEAGWTWERLAGWLPGGMDAEAWEFAIPQMGAMALCRNLRNFDQARISEKAVDTVIAKLTDPDEIKRARLFPYLVWQAYKHAPSDNWKRALATTLDLTTQNIPRDLDNSNIVIDTSASMNSSLSDGSGRRSRPGGESVEPMRRVEVAAVMAAATWRGTNNTDLVIFGDTWRRLEIPRGTSVLKVVETIVGAVGSVGSSTYGHTAMAGSWDPKRHKRVVMFTDDQMWDSEDGQDSHFARYYGRNVAPVSVTHIPLIYTFNLAGYEPSSLPAGHQGRFTLGGFSDASFRMMKALEAGRDGNWEF